MDDLIVIEGESLSRGEAVLLYALYAAEDICEKGFMDGPKILDGKGIEMAKKLEEIGFEPTDAEMAGAVEFIMNFDWGEWLSKKEAWPGGPVA